MLIHYLIRLLMLLVYAGAIGDVFSTILALRAGAHEANPAVGWVMKLIGPKWVIPRLLFGLLNVWIVMHDAYSRENWPGLVSFTLNVALMAYVIWHNVKVTAEQKALNA